MPKRLGKYSASELKVGSKYMLGSLLVEAALLAPARTLTIPKLEKEVTVKGILPLTQNRLADVARTFLNDGVPFLMDTGDRLIQKIGIYELIKDKILDFIYVEADKYSMSDLINYIFEKATFLDRHHFTASIRDWVYSVINTEDDRETFIANMTDNIIAGLRSLVSGPITSVLVSARLLEVIEETISNVVSKFMTTDIGNEMVNRLFDAIEHLEEMTLPYFLDTKANLPRLTMNDKMDALYDAFVGKDLVEKYKQKNLGDQVYNTLISTEYESIWKEIKKHHLKDLVELATYIAGVGIYLNNKAEKKAEKKAFEQSRKEEKLAARVERDAKRDEERAAKKEAKEEKELARLMKKEEKLLKKQKKQKKED